MDARTLLAPGPDASPPDPPAAEQPLGLYVHIPFCAQKCPYCDFNTYARLEPLYAAYTDALCQELTDWAARLAGRTIHTVFVGGGTPTVLSSQQLGQIFETLHSRFALAGDAEITSEANPGTVDQARFALLRGLGVNRLSMGVQSFQPDELAFLGRIHSPADVLRAYDAAVQAGFANINLDFMFGLPGQQPNAWADSLDKALALAPQHLSLYSLIVEPDTPLFHWVQSGQVAPPDDDTAADLYEMAMERLGGAGYRHYEVSNWALPGDKSSGDKSSGDELACRHNLLYWRNQEWIGAGAGAHSHLRLPAPALADTTLADTGLAPDEPSAAVRWSNRKPVQSYTKRVTDRGSPVDFQEALPARVSMGESMLLGLRLLHEGVSFARFARMHGQALGDVFGPELARLQAAGLLQTDGQRVRLTAKGLLLGNRVFAEFI